ncbi:MAG: efflux RND transporter periplasmic adaptor subunit [Candidatus Acidiferrales bacterium]
MKLLRHSPVPKSVSKAAMIFGFLGMVVSLTACSAGKPSVQAADPPQKTTVGVATITRGSLQRVLRLAAEFRPYQEIDVEAKEAGYVKAIYVDIGDRVKEGQLLAVLEIPELQDQVDQSQAAVKESKQDIQRSHYEIAQAQATYQARHLDYTRLANVAKTHPNLIAQQEIDDAQSKDQAAAASVDAAKAALASAQQQLAVAQANQDRVETLFSYARIIAPFTGVITRRYADTGAMIQAGTSSHTQAMPLVRLSQNDLLRLDIPVPESVVPRVHVGMAAQVQVPSLNKNYQGKVVRFADRVDDATRTMDTEIDIPNSKLELVPGMYAYASIVLQSRKDVLTVPVQALDRENGNVSVDRVDRTGKIQKVLVHLGLQTPDRAEVLSGLQLGDMVVVSARSELRVGQEVQPKVVGLLASSGSL